VRDDAHALLVRTVLSTSLALGFGVTGVAQRDLGPPEVPDQFRLDIEAAARMRPRLTAQSTVASGRYSAARVVLEKLTEQVPASSNRKWAWQVRIVEDGQLNAFSSPDGTVYIESGLARLAGPSNGLWAAILSHEIAHVVRRDWARRYLYQKYLENGSGAGIVLGDPSLPSASWSDSEKASADMGRFCRQMELEADREGLMLMARAGYHPDFVPALHHLLHARGVGSQTASLYAMHPCWEERDRELNRAYVASSIEFARLWPEWYASPGGNPPVVVFAEEPTIRKNASRAWEIQIPMRCQNLAGAVEVVLHARAAGETFTHSGPAADGHGAESDMSQLTGCTSPRTTIIFSLEDASVKQPNARWTDVYVLDSWGAVLARADLPKLPH
jgi:Peptidase family M48